MILEANCDVCDFFRTVWTIVSNIGHERGDPAIADKLLPEAFVVRLLKHFDEHFLVVSEKETASRPSLDSFPYDLHRSPGVVTSIYDVAEKENLRILISFMCMFSNEIDQSSKKIGSTVDVADRVDC